MNACLEQRGGTAGTHAHAEHLLLLARHHDQNAQSDSTNPRQLGALDVETILIGEVLGTLEEPEDSNDQSGHHQNQSRNQNDIRKLEIKSCHFLRKGSIFWLECLISVRLGLRTFSPPAFRIGKQTFVAHIQAKNLLELIQGAKTIYN